MSQKAILLINNKNLPEFCQLILQTTQENNGVNLYKVLTWMRKNCATLLSDQVFDESHGRFETLLKLVYGTLDDSCNNIANYFSLLCFR